MSETGEKAWKSLVWTCEISNIYGHLNGDVRLAVRCINKMHQGEIWVGDTSGSCQNVIEHHPHYSCSNDQGLWPKRAVSTIEVTFSALDVSFF